MWDLNSQSGNQESHTLLTGPARCYYFSCFLEEFVYNKYYHIFLKYLVEFTSSHFNTEFYLQKDS